MKFAQKFRIVVTLSMLALLGLLFIQPKLPTLENLPGRSGAITAPHFSVAEDPHQTIFTIVLHAAHAPKLSNAAANAAADAVCTLLNTGYLRIYDGTQPATADTAISGNTLLAELRFGATAFGSASGGVATANAITSDTDADATGTASWIRVLKTDGTTVVEDFTVGTSGADLNLASVSISIHSTVAISSLTYTQSKS